MFVRRASKPLSIFISIILKQYFASRTCFWLPDEENDHILKRFNALNRDVYIVNFSKPLLGHSNDKEIREQDDLRRLLPIKSYYCNNFVIQSDYPLKSFESIESTLQNAVETKYYDRYYLFYPAKDGFKDNLLESKLLQRVFNVILVNVTQKHSKNNHTVNVLKIFRPEINNKLESYEKNMFSYEFNDWSTYTLKMSSFKENLPELFKTKLDRGLVFNYAAFSYGFYINIEKNTGIELKTILTYCKKHNFVCNVSISHDMWGEIYGNSSDFGPLKWAVDGQVDVAIGGFYLGGRKLEYLDFVGPTGRIDITCLVPKPRVAVNISTLLKSFNLVVWLGIFGLLLVFSVITKWTLSGHKVDFIECIFLITSITLQQSHQIIIYTKKCPPSLHYLLTIYVCFTLVMATAYTSHLYSLLSRDEYENVIQTVADLEDSGYFWGARHATYIESLSNMEDYKYKRLLSRFQAISDENALIRRFYKGDYGLLTEKMRRAYILNPVMRAKGLRRFTALKESLFWVYTTFVLGKHSPFYESLSMHVMNVFESGHLLHWELEQLHESNHNIQHVLEFQPNNDYHPLSINHMLGIFLLWLFGITTALLFFIYEVCQYKKQKPHKQTHKNHISDII